MSLIELHYNTIEEKDRLSRDTGQLEAERTRTIILRHLPSKPASILDVGGGAGAYAFWLAGLEHQVTLIDITPKHVNQARELQQQAIHKLANIAEGDARDLWAYKTGSYDVVLFLGPLYHLTQEKDRLQAIREAFRVLKPGGKLIAAGIQRYASLYDGLSRGLIDDPYFLNIMKQDLRDGQHRNPENIPHYFTTAYFQLPAEMKKEMMDSGFTIAETAAVEGPLWFASNFEARWKNEQQRKQLLDILQLIEHDENLLNITLHYLVVAKK